MILPDMITPLMSAMQRGTATYHQSPLGTAAGYGVPTTDNKPHYLEDAGLLKLMFGGGIPERLFGERGFIDPERSNILLKKYLNKFGGVSDRYLSEEEINKKISTWRQKRSGIE